MPPAVALLCTALLAGFWAIERKAFLQAMLSRPVVVGACLGLVWGTPCLGIAIGCALELFFLGEVNIGAALPGNDLWASLAALTFAAGLNAAASETWRPSALFALAVTLGVLFARLGRRADSLQERRCVRLCKQSMDAACRVPTARLFLAGCAPPALMSMAVVALTFGLGLGAGHLGGHFWTHALPRFSANLVPRLARASDLTALAMTLAAAAIALSALDVARARLTAAIAALLATAIFVATRGLFIWSAT